MELCRIRLDAALTQSPHDASRSRRVYVVGVDGCEGISVVGNVVLLRFVDGGCAAYCGTWEGEVASDSAVHPTASAKSKTA